MGHGIANRFSRNQKQIAAYVPGEKWRIAIYFDLDGKVHLLTHTFAEFL